MNTRPTSAASRPPNAARRPGNSLSRPETASELALPWIIRLRYSMAAGQIATALIASFFFGIDLPLGWLAVGPALVGISNLWLARMLRQHNSSTALSRAVNAIFVLDIACLTGLLLLAGGPTNPFSLLYLVHITLAATILTERQTWFLGGLSTICFGLLFWKYRPIPALELHHPGTGLNLHLLGMWVSFAVAAFLVAMFSAKISGLLREREASLLHMHEELAKKDRLASLVTLAAGAAHELGTPLGTIALVAKELELYATRTASLPAVADDSRLIRTEVERCRKILQRMSIEGAEPSGEALELVTLSDLMTSVRAVFEQVPAVDFAVDVDVALGPLVPALTIPRHAVEQALIALIKNAVEASPATASIHVKVTPAAESVRFLIADRGHGMTPETLRHVGEPFFTTKDPGKGMGLGVFLVRILCERLGGRIQFDSAPGGTTATLELPLRVPVETTAR